MEYTRPNECIQFVVRVVDALAVDVEMKIEIPPYGIHVVINIVDLLGFPHNINIVHLA